MNRRDLLKGAGVGSAAAFLGLLTNPAKPRPGPAPPPIPATPKLGPLKITKVRPILTAPQRGIRFVVVKVETSEPGLYGLGCATFNSARLP